MDKEQLVSTLKLQHKGLQADLGGLFDTTNGADIVAGLAKFKGDLMNHLGLENGTFYAELLKDMKTSGMDTKATEAFIAAMDDIAKVVTAFLEKYAKEESVKDMAMFRQNLNEIVAALNIRIESEEEGVYETFLTI
jgi:hypothetical protein